MIILDQFEMAVPVEPSAALPLSSETAIESADIVLVFSGGLTDNAGRVYWGKEGVTTADGMPLPGGVYTPLAAEMSVRGGFHMGNIYFITGDADQVLRVILAKDKP